MRARWQASRSPVLRMLTQLTLAKVVRRQVSIAPHEAVAVAQLLTQKSAFDGEAQAPCGPLSTESVTIASDGTVRAKHHAATPSVAELAIFLRTLLEGTRIPGALRYAVGRALLEVDGPPFDTLQEFSQALERYEQGDRAAAVGALAWRAEQVTPFTPARPAHPPDRRRQPTQVAALRRELRHADQRLFEARRRAGAPAWRRTRSLPVAACVLAGLALIAAGTLTSPRAPNTPAAPTAHDRALPPAGPATTATPPAAAVEAATTRQGVQAAPSGERGNATRPRPVPPRTLKATSRPPIVWPPAARATTVSTGQPESEREAELERISAGVDCGVPPGPLTGVRGGGCPARARVAELAVHAAVVT